MTVSRYLLVPCPFCGAEAEQVCHTQFGRQLDTHPHAMRWKAFYHCWRSRPMRFELLAHDPRFKLSAGDLLVCIAYALDPSKVTVLYRETDGFDPMCNQYTTNVRFLGFLPERARINPAHV